MRNLSHRLLLKTVVKRERDYIKNILKIIRIVTEYTSRIVIEIEMDCKIKKIL